jgi:hypothetical protein
MGRLTEIEYVLTTHKTVNDLVSEINGLVAKHQREYFLADLYVYDRKAKLIFELKKGKGD